VLQLSIDRRLRPQDHFDLARALAPLRDEGVLILASGNVTHNLRDAMMRMQTGNTATPDWARDYDGDVAKAIEQHDAQALIDLWPDSEHARMAHPSPDHWLPLLYAQAASSEADAVSFPTEGFDLGALSMRNVKWG
jgi:4,5-DOPA dioxygenase extradiol